MSVDSRIVAALTPLGYNVANTVSYAKGKTYFAFNYETVPADFGDDAPQHERYLIQIHFFCPLNVNITSTKRSVKQMLYASGFTWPSTEDASDSDGRHIVFECEVSEGVDLDGDA